MGYTAVVGASADAAIGNTTVAAIRSATTTKNRFIVPPSGPTEGRSFAH